MKENIIIRSTGESGKKIYTTPTHPKTIRGFPPQESSILA
jgi:hypothetical protein